MDVQDVFAYKNSVSLLPFLGSALNSIRNLELKASLKLSEIIWKGLNQIKILASTEQCSKWKCFNIYFQIDNL